MITSIIKYDQVTDKLRLDAEYYRPEFLKTEKLLKRTKYKILFEVAKISKARKNPAKKPELYFKYIDISNIDLIFGTITTQKIKGFLAPSRARKLVRENDVIISTVRPNRNAVAIIPKELDGDICSTGFSVIKSEKINPYFLFAFLKTKFAIHQLVRQTMASMYPAVSENDIANIIVPLVSEKIQKEIEELVKQAHQKKKLADEKYEEANRLLLKEIGLDNLLITEQKAFEVKFSETKERIDADYYKPEYKTIADLLQQNEKRGLFKLQKLSNVCMLKKGIEVGSEAYTKEGVLFLRVSNISETGLTEGESSEYITPYLFEQLREEYGVRENDILYTKDATIGIALVVDRDFPKAIPSMGVVRLRSKEIDPYYIALVLNSIACRSQSDREVIGAVIKHYNFTKLKNLLVPIVPNQKQENIAELVKQSFSLRKEAKQLLDEATEKIENETKQIY
jgi:restriction endonuclease S subunit